LSEAVKEMKFVVNLLESMQIKVNYPIKCRVGNIGAIFMSQNVTTTSRAKHIDIRTKFVGEYVENGKIKIVFIRSGDNDSDIMTKNVQRDLDDKHSKRLIGKQH
jgi:topoisomerase IA-like protein